MTVLEPIPGRVPILIGGEMYQLKPEQAVEYARSLLIGAARTGLVAPPELLGVGRRAETEALRAIARREAARERIGFVRDSDDDLDAAHHASPRRPARGTIEPDDDNALS